MTDIVRLHNLVYHTKVLGPGDRAAVWFQGCHRRCEGCMSASSRPLDGGRLASITKICDAILQQKGLEGVTVSGGEPFLQPQALYALLEQLRSRSGLGVIVYTGYTLEQLQQLDDPWVRQALERIDLLIDGEYVEELNDGASLKGSSNQRLHFLTDRYLPYEHLYRGSRRDAEVRLTGNQVFFVGIPSRQTWQQWQSAVEAVDTDNND